MAFEKRVACENTRIVNADRAAISQIFSRLGKDQATELEILRTARDLGLKIQGLSAVCTTGDDGQLSPKTWSE